MILASEELLQLYIHTLHTCVNLSVVHCCPLAGVDPVNDSSLSPTDSLNVYTGWTHGP